VDRLGVPERVRGLENLSGFHVGARVARNLLLLLVLFTLIVDC